MSIYKVNYKEINLIEIIGLYIVGGLLLFIGLGWLLKDGIIITLLAVPLSILAIYIGHRKSKNRLIFKEGFLLDVNSDKFIYPNEKTSQLDEIKISSIYSIQTENEMKKSFNIFLLILVLFMPSINTDSRYEWVYILHIRSRGKEETLSFEFFNDTDRNHLFNLIAKLANLS